MVNDYMAFMDPVVRNRHLNLISYSLTRLVHSITPTVSTDNNDDINTEGASKDMEYQVIKGCIIFPLLHVSSNQQKSDRAI